MGDNNVVMKLPEEVLQRAVESQLAAVIEEQSPTLIRDLVRMAMSEKSSNNYGRKSVFQKLMDDHIRTVAMVAANEYFEELKPLVKEEVRRLLGVKLKNPQKRARDLAERLVDAIVTNCTIKISVQETY